MREVSVSVTERGVEAHLVRGVKRMGGLAWKWVSPGMAGVPDRIIILPGGKIIFAELKTEAGKLRPVQRVAIRELKELGCDVRVLHGMGDVDSFLEEVEKWILSRTRTSGTQ